METRNWNRLRFGVFSITTRKNAVSDPKWQAFRDKLRNMPLQLRYTMLEDWIKQCNDTMMSRIQVTNYVDSLKRAKLIDPETTEIKVPDDEEQEVPAAW